MCGITGLITRNPFQAQDMLGAVRRMTDSLHYRGPDAGGVWSAPHVVLGHRRLSIIDLSEAGLQPLHDAHHGLHISFNGEIYNYQDVRAKILERGYQLRTQTDTEVILGAYHCFGEEFVQYLRGMFAFIIYDENSRKAVLGRDRLGKKPLYYYHDRNMLAAASELKCFYALPGFYPTIDAESVKAFFSLQYIPGPHTICNEIKRVEPGHLMELTIDSWSLTTKCYWSVGQCLSQPAVNAVISGEEIHAALQESVRYRLIADVEIGMLLSGGVDSSLLSCCAMQQVKVPLRGFLVSFADRDLDETRYARTVAESLGMELLCIDGGSLDAPTLERVLFHADEPSGDPALIPTYMISEALSHHVKVVMSGEGADELFWGYDHYRREKIYQALRLAMVLKFFHPFTSTLKRWEGIESNPANPEVLSRLLKVFSASEDLGCARWTTVFGEPALHRLIPEDDTGKGCPPRFMQQMSEWLETLHGSTSPLTASLALDLVYWLPDDLLAKVDRMTMAHSVEARTPYLDHVLVEKILLMPGCLKTDFLQNKAILRQLLRKMLPTGQAEAIAYRKKHGFGVPLQAWLGSQLRTFAEEHFNASALKDFGLLDVFYLRKLWQDFQRHGGSSAFARKLWLALCFAVWYSHHRNRFGFPSGS